jgi:hypothetical protein
MILCSGIVNKKQAFRAYLVRERVGAILYASVHEKAVGTDLSDGLPVFGRFSVCSEKAGQGSLNLTKHALRSPRLILQET